MKYVKQITFGAIAIALSTVTSLIHLWDMPMGGSVTLFSMLFITLIGYWFGLRAGLTTAIAYGLLQLLFDPYILSIPQLFIDYIAAFGALGLSGIMHDKKHGLVLGYIIGVAGRFVFCVFSGVVFFGSYAPENMGAFLYSFLYNGAYMGAELVITVILLEIPAVRKALDKVKEMALSDTKSAVS